MPRMEIAEIIAELKSRFDETTEDEHFPLELEDLVAWDVATGRDRSALFNATALQLARGFHDRRLDCWFCDTVVNAPWGHYQSDMLEDDSVLRAKGASLFYATYDAFDAGESSRVPGEDPVQLYTRPLIAKLLGIMN